MSDMLGIVVGSIASLALLYLARHDKAEERATITEGLREDHAARMVRYDREREDRLNVYTRAWVRKGCFERRGAEPQRARPRLVVKVPMRSGH
jgi:hypothetical protein